MTRVMANQAISVVRERDRRRIWAMAAVLGLGVCLVGVVLGYVGLQVHRVRVTYRLEELRRQRTQLEERTRKLRLELESLRSPARVDALAARLGLTRPARDQVRLAREFVTPDAGGQARASLQAATGEDGAARTRGRP